MLSSLCVKVQLQHVRDYKSFIEENFLHNIDPQIIKSFIIVVIQLLLFLLRWFRAAADKHTNTHTHTKKKAITWQKDQKNYLNSKLKYFNFEASFQLRWCRARDLTTGHRRIYIVCKRFAVQILLGSLEFVIRNKISSQQDRYLNSVSGKDMKTNKQFWNVAKPSFTNKNTR